MYGLVLVVGDVLDRFGRRRGLYAGLALMTVSNAALAWLGGVGGMSLALFGLGLGWNLSYVAATTELVSLTAANERGRIVGFGDLCASFTAAGLALLGGVVYTTAGVAVLALAAAALAAVPALGIAARIRYTGAPADAASAPFS
jgi:MFS family permease